MTNRDAINLLEEVKILDDTMYAYNPSYLEALDMALTALEAEEKWYATHEYPPKPQWIPVSERLPKPYEYCLWTTTDGRVIYHHCDGLFSNYTAWMPLPEPYEERRTDE